MDEIQAYYEGELPLEDLSETGRHFVATLHAGNITAISRGFGIIDHSGEPDRHGPFPRITWTVDALSGEERRWVGVTELTDRIRADEVISSWAHSIARSTEESEVGPVVAALIDVWSALVLTDDIAGEVDIELSFDADGPLWRTLRPADGKRTAIEQHLIAHLRNSHGGHQRSDVEGRAQITLPEFEVFLGPNASARRSGLTLTERPLVASVLVGIRLRGNDWRDWVEEWVNAPERPEGFVVEIHAGDGCQVWVDAVLDDDPIGELDLLLEHARILWNGLRPWDDT